MLGAPAGRWRSGGFGAYLLMHHEWARPDATARSYELFARHVVPRFQGTAERLRAAAEYARSRWSELDRAQAAAIRGATDRHAAERGARRRAETR